MAKSKIPTSPPVHHYARAFAAATFGFLAMSLISASILVVWANRTLTDTNAFAQAVGPVIQRPELQEFVAGKVTDQLLQSAPTSDLASQLLAPADLAGKTPEQLQTALRPVIHDSVVEILKAPKVQQSWQDTSRSAHADLIRQLDAGADEVSVDLGPLVDTALAELKQTKLAPVAAHIDLKPSAAKVDLKGAPLEKIRSVYKGLKTGTILLVLLALVLAALAVWTSIHHGKTLRRILVSTGIAALVVAAVVSLPAVVRAPNADPAAAKAALAVAGTLLHGLQTGCLVLGVTCIVAAIGYKLASSRLS
jgi:hypothetical protein